MANCSPCLKLGLQVVAHYAADLTAGKEAECYYHHFGMPLPTSIQAKIAQPKPAAESDGTSLQKIERAQQDRSERDDAKARGLDVDEIRKAGVPVPEKNPDRRLKDEPYGTKQRAGLTPDVCAECWRDGHACPAHCTVDKERLCIDCADGKPCAIAREKAASTRTPAHERYRVTIPGVKKPRAADIALLTDESGKITGVKRTAPTRPAAPVESQFPQMASVASIQVPTVGKDRPEEKEMTPMAKKLCACGCGTELKADSVWDYVKGHRTKPEKKKRCACGCGTSLVNRHPYIKGHNPDEKKGAAAPGSKPTPPRNSAARVETPITGIATICVTEAHMDSFWSKLSLEEKANLFQRQLEGA
jgi:hypothetical protein